MYARGNLVRDETALQKVVVFTLGNEYDRRELRQKVKYPNPLELISGLGVSGLRCVKIGGWEWFMLKYVVVVDDDKEIREIITFALTRNGFDVAVASNGIHLQNLLDTRIPDLILLDVMMPGQDGYQIFDHLRRGAATRHIPVVIMTAHSEDIYARISSDLGAEHVTKPFHPIELVEKVKSLLSGVKSEHQRFAFTPHTDLDVKARVDRDDAGWG